MPLPNLERMRELVLEQVDDPLFVTVSGSHIYGFSSPDSDVDLRGAFRLPLRELVGLKQPTETREKAWVDQGLEIDLVAHEIGKYLGLLIKNNGYILEQIFSPLVVLGGDFLEQLRPLAARCITRFHAHHYQGFLRSQVKKAEQEEPKKVKTLLYAYRVVLTGIHLLETGEIQPHLPTLNEKFRISYIDDLIAQKVTEKAAAVVDWNFHQQELNNWDRKLQEAYDRSALPENRDWEAVNKFLISLRLG